MVVGAIASVIAAGASVVSGIQQRKEAKKAAKAQKKAQDISNRQAALQRQREIRQSIAQARVRRAQALAAEGGMMSSTTAGQVSAQTTNIGGAIGASNQATAAAFGISQAQDDYSRHMMKAQHNVWGDVATISGAVASAAGSYGAAGGTWGSFKGMFSGLGGGNSMVSNGDFSPIGTRGFS